MKEDSKILEWDSKDSYHSVLMASVYQQILFLHNIIFTIIIYIHIGGNVSNPLFKRGLKAP